MMALRGSRFSGAVGPAEVIQLLARLRLADGPARSGVLSGMTSHLSPTEEPGSLHIHREVH